MFIKDKHDSNQYLLYRFQGFRNVNGTYFKYNFCRNAEIKEKLNFFPDIQI